MTLIIQIAVIVIIVYAAARVALWLAGLLDDLDVPPDDGERM